jgi:hypothetical protein
MLPVTMLLGIQRRVLDLLVLCQVGGGACHRSYRYSGSFWSVITILSLIGVPIEEFFISDIVLFNCRIFT